MQIIHQMWVRNEIRGVLSAMEKMCDHAVSTLATLSYAFNNHHVTDYMVSVNCRYLLIWQVI
jgi:hypothetical protein